MANKKQASPTAQETSRPLPLVPILSVCWLVIFFVLYFTTTLGDTRGELTRLQILFEVPNLLWNNLFPLPVEYDSGWTYLPQRFDLLCFATLIWIAAYSAGTLICRCLIRQYQLSTAEHICFSMGTGLAALSLLTLVLGLIGLLSRVLVLILFAVIVAAAGFVAWRDGHFKARKNKTSELSNGWLRFAFITCGLFLLPAVLGSMLPSIDFDVKEYHLGGPKEYFLNGYISMLPHNVYTSFPFLAEMLSLLGMVLADDWWRGALVGKLVLMSFGPITALAVYAVGARLYSPFVGLWGAVFYLATPWAYRISVIAYVEGALSCYLTLTTLAIVVWWQEWGRHTAESSSEIESSKTDETPHPPFGHLLPREKDWMTLFIGLLAGCGIACKYPGLVQVAFPAGVLLVGLCYWRNRSAISVQQLVMTVVLFSLGVLITFGPWALKNLMETGNPVYPLVYSLMGGADWDAALDAKWKSAHSPPHHHLMAVMNDLQSIALGSTWQTCTAFLFLPLACLWTGEKKRASIFLLGGVLYLFLAWWVLTHRIDRFWVPMMPLVTILSAAGAVWVWDHLSRYAVICILAIVLPFNLAVVTSGLCGPNYFLADLAAAKEMAASTAPGIQKMNELLPEGSKVLLVGEAQIFDAEFPLDYNTVFDQSIFEKWTGEIILGEPLEKWPLRSAEEIRETFQRNGITHVYVNWVEILRYRTTYGYTPYVTPERFEELQRLGILDQPLPLTETPLMGLSEAERKEAEQLLPKLIRGRGKSRWLTSGLLYPVKEQSLPAEN
ncbi:hypothetical protein [Calycomorphotria hydatis]|uniref:Glycosyltransferase RgtA/B/C/D-like domain-containing protein n=1 Tax=Calycomorphotria hydatis TaxID=2528027 RepID=A0A517T3V4_9PLAN|nr:hypothetical protein [Calycomorphotria hydatis]QDT63049.1 hypothetical protein V22_02480 [Calycomorphotria hydatis]